MTEKDVVANEDKFKELSVDTENTAPNLCTISSFYIEDGNHRALVYAVHLELRKTVYEPNDIT